MVDVGSKPTSERSAVAEGWIQMASATLEQIQAGNSKKGDVLGIARIAGIQAAKRTAELIPLCHPLALSSIDIKLTPQTTPPAVYCCVTVKTVGQTGVEIEALTAVQIALLTVYDMCKAVDRGMTLTDIRLVAKAGGVSGTWQR